MTTLFIKLVINAYPKLNKFYMQHVLMFKLNRRRFNKILNDLFLSKGCEGPINKIVGIIVL